MCGSSSTPQTQTTVTEYPSWLSDAMQNNIGIANQLADQGMAQGYQQYGGPRVADFNTFQSQAFQNTAANQNAWAPFLQSGSDSLGYSNQLAQNVAQSASQNAQINPAYAGPATMAGMQSAGPGASVSTQNLSQTNLSGYMNPYDQSVTQSTLGNIEQARQMQNLTNSDAATKARAFGGSRHGVVEAQTNAGFAKQAADTALQANQANFGNAQQQAQTDLTRQLQASLANQGSYNSANQFNAGLAAQTGQYNAGAANDMAQYNAGLAQQAGIANAGSMNQAANTQLSAAALMGQNAQGAGSMAALYQQLLGTDAGNLLNAGNMMQDQQQSLYDVDYQNWQNAQNHPYAMLGLRQSAVSGTPYQPGQSTTTPLYRNRTNGFLGGAASAYGATQNPWMAALGGLFGAYG